MSKSSESSPIKQRTESNTFTIGIQKLVDYALDSKKSLRFKMNFNFPPDLHNSRYMHIKEQLENELRDEGLNAYISRVVLTKTYLHKEGRSYLEKSMRSMGIVNNKVRKKAI